MGGEFCDAGGAWAGEWTTGLGCWAAAGGTVDWAGERAGSAGAGGPSVGLGGVRDWWSTSARVAVRVSQSA